MTTFEPFASDGGKASWSTDRKQITSTVALRAELRLKITDVKVIDGTFLVMTFDVDDDSPLKAEA